MFRMKNKALSGLDGDKLSKNFLTYAVLLAALGAMTFFGVCDPTGRKFGRGGGGGPAASVGSENISRLEFQRSYQRVYSQYQRMYQDAFDPAQLRLAHGVLRELINERILFKKAVDLGLRASDDEVIDLLSHEQAFKGEDGKFSDEIFNRFLNGNGYTEAGFLEEMRRSMTLQKLRRFITETPYMSQKAAELDYRVSETKLDLEYLKFDPQKMAATVQAADIDKFLADKQGKARVKEYFDNNPSEFNRQEQIQARHILISFKGARNATPEASNRDKAAAKKHADELLAIVQAPGADFIALASKNTDEPSGKTKGGDLGWFGRDAMEKAFSDAAFALKKGQVSGVVETPFGFHIIKVEDYKPALKQTVEQADRQIAESILLKEKRPLVAKEGADKVFTELKGQKPIEALLKNYQVSWASTGEVNADARYLPGIGATNEVSDALVTLRQAGSIFPRVLDIRGNFYILKLKSRKEPDLSKLTDDKRKELALAESYQNGAALYQYYSKKFETEAEKQSKVWLNPDILALDDPKTGEKG